MKYSDLQVWQKAMDLVAKIYEVTRSLPIHERFGLVYTSTCRGIDPSNIARSPPATAYFKFLTLRRMSVRSP